MSRTTRPWFLPYPTVWAAKGTGSIVNETETLVSDGPRITLTILILLDVMLPKKSGFDVCLALRHGGIDTPILMLTARAQVTDKVEGLDLGADDYLTKPFEFIELLARIKALLRRSSPEPRIMEFRFGEVEVNFVSANVVRNGVAVKLSALEYQLLRHLIENQDVLLSRNDLLDAVWGVDAMPSTRTVDVHIAWLRQKLEPDPHNPRFILTVRGLGYKFVGEVGTSSFPRRILRR